jgi:L-threonylcarbamoyladenylate synthase
MIVAASDRATREAAQLLRAGELVSFPTETVYGLGADATNERAVAKIYAAIGPPRRYWSIGTRAPTRSPAPSGPAR